MSTTLQTYNFVNSVKGGVGKTALSVLLANYMEQMKPENVSGFKGEIMLLDFDLQGTAMEKLFYGTKEHSTHSEEYVYLDKIITENRNITKKNYKHKLGDTNHTIDAIFSNDSMETKLLYRVGAKNNYSSAVTYDLFRKGVWRGVENLKDQGYGHFIFDMSPSFDAFASGSIETICREKEKQKVKEAEGKHINEKIIINMFYVTGMDAAQIMVTFEEVKNMLTIEEHFIFDNLFIVFNDIPNVMDISSNPVEEIKEKVSKDLLFTGITEIDKKHIFYLYMPFNDKYALFNRNGDGLYRFQSPREEEESKNKVSIREVLSIPPSTGIWDTEGKDIYDYTESNSQEKLLKIMLEEKR